MDIKTDTMAEKKLALLYYINSFSIPITNEQISEFYMKNMLINYFDLQNYLLELIDNKFINTLLIYGREYYAITSEGKSTMELLLDIVPMYLLRKIDDYVIENKDKIIKDSQVTGSYLKLDDKNYQLRCGLYEENQMLLELKLNVVSRKQATGLVKSWKKNALAVYSGLLEKLIEGYDDDE